MHKKLYLVGGIAFALFGILDLVYYIYNAISVPYTYGFKVWWQPLIANIDKCAFGIIFLIIAYHYYHKYLKSKE